LARAIDKSSMTARLNENHVSVTYSRGRRILPFHNVIHLSTIHIQSLRNARM